MHQRDFERSNAHKTKASKKKIAITVTTSVTMAGTPQPLPEGRTQRGADLILIRPAHRFSSVPTVRIQAIMATGWGLRPATEWSYCHLDLRAENFDVQNEERRGKIAAEAGPRAWRWHSADREAADQRVGL